MDGEKWFKSQSIIAADLNQFLKQEYQDPQWRKGIMRSWLQPEWQETLRSIQLYITCEGRFHTVYLYQMRFLCHIVGVKAMNLLYFVLKFLAKMYA